MPTYKVPPDKNSLTAIPAETKKSKEPSYPRVYIPANAAILKAFEVGGDIEVTLKGKVKGMSQSDYNTELQMTVEEVNATPENEFSKLAADDEES